MDSGTIFMIVGIGFAVMCWSVLFGVWLGRKVQRDEDEKKLEERERGWNSDWQMALHFFRWSLYEPAAYAAARDPHPAGAAYKYWQDVVEYLFKYLRGGDYSSVRDEIEKIHTKILEKVTGVLLIIEQHGKTYVGRVCKPWVVQMTTKDGPIPGAKEYLYWSAEEVKNWGRKRISTVADNLPRRATGYQVMGPDGFVIETGDIAIRDLTQPAP